jgi:hypothetical protein
VDPARPGAPGPGTGRADSERPVRPGRRRTDVGSRTPGRFATLLPPGWERPTPWRVGLRARSSVPGIRLSVSTRLRSRVLGTWDPGPGTGSMPRTEHRAPKTEPAIGKPAHRVCILHPVSTSHGESTGPRTRIMALLLDCPTAVRLKNIPLASIPIGPYHGKGRTDGSAGKGGR